MFYLEPKDIKYLKNSEDILQKLETVKRIFSEANISADWKDRQITVSDSGEVRINIAALFSTK